MGRNSTAIKLTIGSQLPPIVPARMRSRKDSDSVRLNTTTAAVDEHDVHSQPRRPYTPPFQLDMLV